MKQLENLWFCTAPDPNIKFAPRPPRFPTKFWPKRPRWKLTLWELEVVTVSLRWGVAENASSEVVRFPTT